MKEIRSMVIELTAQGKKTSRRCVQRMCERADRNGYSQVTWE